MNIYIFLLCYNESVLLPHTIAHYRSYMPNCNIIIYDNMSTDNSVSIAESLGCLVIKWKSNGMNDFKQSEIKNTCWRNITNGWVICADMDEWLCVTDDDLYNEYLNGTTVLQIKGINIVGNSNSVLLDDVNLHRLSNGFYFIFEHKKLCFFVPEIKSVKYSTGAHRAKFTGNIKYSKKIYINKHMDLLGLPFFLNKKKNRANRLVINGNDKLSSKNVELKNIWYSSNMNFHKKYYNFWAKKSKNYSHLLSNDLKIIQLFLNLFISLI